MKINTQYYNEFWAFLKSNGIKNFTPDEVLNCEENSNGTIKQDADSGVYNDPPHQKIWEACIPVLKTLEEVRDELGIYIVVNSFWRDHHYNRVVGGTANSYHTKFIAADIVPHYKNGRLYPIIAFYDYLDKKLGDAWGLQEYDNRVHIDSREEKYRKTYYRR